MVGALSCMSERGEAYYNVTQWTLSILKYNVPFELHGPRVDVKS